MRLAIPDLISNSYFPALAAAELGCFAREGMAVSAELIFPVDRTYAALRDGEIDFVGSAAHGALAASISEASVAAINAFSRDVGVLAGDVPYEQIVPAQFSDLWLAEHGVSEA